LFNLITNCEVRATKSDILTYFTLEPYIKLLMIYYFYPSRRHNKNVR